MRLRIEAYNEHNRPVLKTMRLMVCGRYANTKATHLLARMKSKGADGLVIPDDAVVGAHLERYRELCVESNCHPRHSPWGDGDDCEHTDNPETADIFTFYLTQG